MPQGLNLIYNATGYLSQRKLHDAALYINHAGVERFDILTDL